MSIEIKYASENYFKSYHDTLNQVAHEKIYIEMIEAPPLEKVISVQKDLISKNGPIYYAIEHDRVIGWCDIFPSNNPRMSHRGGLGMGLLSGFRGKGIGSQLLSATLRHARQFGLEKVELSVYASNTAAIALYKKFQFVEEGLIKHYRKLDGEYFDCISMGKFL